MMRWIVRSYLPALRRGRVLVPLATAALLFTTVGIGPAVPDAAARPGPRGSDTVRAAEFPTSYLHGSAAIPRGSFGQWVYDRRILSNALIFVSVDTSAMQGLNWSLPGIKVANHVAGRFFVTTSDLSTASVGVPFTYVILNATAIGNMRAFQATIPAGSVGTTVSDSTATTSSNIVLTIDTTGSGVGAVPALKVAQKAGGSFAVRTANGTAAPSGGIRFNAMVVNGSASPFLSGRGTIPSGTTNTSLIVNGVSLSAAVLVTSDTSTIGASISVAGVKLSAHSAGSMKVSTERLTTAPGSGLPFDFVVVQPVRGWEELGPTGRSGNSWAVAVDPRNASRILLGSQYAGVWRTVDGGNTWSSMWAGLRQVGIVSFATAPGNPDTVYALARNGFVWVTTNAGITWSQFATQAVPGMSDVYSQRAYGLGTPGAGTVYACSPGGLFARSSGGSAWSSFSPQTGTHACTDVRVLNITGKPVFAAFKDIGVWEFRSNLWTRIKAPLTGALAGHPIKIGLSPSEIVLNYDCDILKNDVSSTGFVDTSWTDLGTHCGTSQGGYALSVAVSPSDPKHFIVGSVEIQVTKDGGSTWTAPPALTDNHDVMFWSDSRAYVANDFGLRFTTDGGSTWHQSPSNDKFIDGPPDTEFHHLTVSLADVYGRIFVGGNAQDNGAISMVGRPAGFTCCGGEAGLEVVAPRPSFTPPEAGEPKTSRWYVKATNGSSATMIRECQFDLPGPDYSALATEEGHAPEISCPVVQDLGAQIFAIAVSQAAATSTLVGTNDGKVWREVSGSPNSFVKLMQRSGDPVRTVAFVADTVALVGFTSGAIVKITNPFGSPSLATITPTSPPAPGRVVGFAAQYGQSSTLYAAFDKAVFRTTDGGAHWANITGGPLTTSLNSGPNVVDLAYDPLFGQAYAATGYKALINAFGWNAQSPGNPGVFRWSSSTSAWTDVGQGIPAGLPITDIGIAPDRALYISTEGRGVWWRRDIGRTVK